MFKTLLRVAIPSDFLRIVNNRSQRVSYYTISLRRRSRGGNRTARKLKIVKCEACILAVFFIQANRHVALGWSMCSSGSTSSRYVWIIMIIDCQNMYPVLNVLLEQNNALTSFVQIHWPWIALAAPWTYVHESHNISLCSKFKCVLYFK